MLIVLPEWPLAAAAWTGVQLSTSALLMSAPWLTSTLASSRLLSSAACWLDYKYVMDVRYTTWCRAVIPAMLILFTSISRLTLRSIITTISSSLSFTQSWKTSSSGNLTLFSPGWWRAKKLALLDMSWCCNSLGMLMTEDCCVYHFISNLSDSVWYLLYLVCTTTHWYHTVSFITNTLQATGRQGDQQILSISTTTSILSTRYWL